jgi:hypothetical protein
MRKPVKFNNPFNPLACLTGPTVLGNGRVFIPTGQPIYLGDAIEHKNPRRVDEPLPDYAQCFIGLYSSILHRGKNNPITAEEIRDYINEARILRIGIKKSGVSVIGQLGVWEGDKEPSVQVLIFFKPTEHEWSYAGFKDSIFALLESLIVKFGQYSILLNFYREGKPESSYQYKHDLNTEPD